MCGIWTQQKMGSNWGSIAAPPPRPLRFQPLVDRFKEPTGAPVQPYHWVERSLSIKGYVTQASDVAGASMGYHSGNCEEGGGYLIQTDTGILYDSHRPTLMNTWFNSFRSIFFSFFGISRQTSPSDSSWRQKSPNNFVIVPMSPSLVGIIYR